jgi:regulator of sirC expression with transglutaminase-like and TPR domain
VTTTTALERFARVVQREDDAIELDVAALLLGDLAGGGAGVDVAGGRRRLDDIAARAEPAIARACAAADAQAPVTPIVARVIARTLFADLGFRGNSEDYYDPRNSFLGDVLDRRVGIPITLSVLYMEVARRVGLRAAGVGFPGHFLVRVDGGGTLLLDPFNGGAELGRGELLALLQRAQGDDAELDDGMLAPASKRAILHRMLTNLASIYGRAGDLHLSIEVLERQALLDAGNPRIAAAIDQLRGRLASLN